MTSVRQRFAYQEQAHDRRTRAALRVSWDIPAYWKPPI
jgi:hypothetical protein